MKQDAPMILEVAILVAGSDLQHLLES